MSLQISITVPGHEANVSNIQSTNMTAQQLYDFLYKVCMEDHRVLKAYIAQHTRTGATINSIVILVREQSGDRVVMTVGSETRGNILRFLDKGRKDVYPINRKFLRWLTFPEGVVVFSKHSRAVPPSNIMKTAANAAVAKIPEFANEVLKR
jgi:hypothetical protein